MLRFRYEESALLIRCEPILDDLEAIANLTKEVQEHGRSPSHMENLSALLDALERHVAAEGLDAILLIKAHAEENCNSVYKDVGVFPFKKITADFMNIKGPDAFDEWAGNDAQRLQVEDWAMEAFPVVEVVDFESMEDYLSFMAENSEANPHSNLGGQNDISVMLSQMVDQVMARFEAESSSGGRDMSHASQPAASDEESRGSTQGGRNSEHSIESSQNDDNAAYRG